MTTRARAIARTASPLEFLRSAVLTVSLPAIVIALSFGIGLNGPSLLERLFKSDTFRTSEIAGTWVEVNPYDSDNPGTFEFKGSKLTYSVWGANGTVSFLADVYSKDPLDVELNFEDGRGPFEWLVYHLDTVDGHEIPIISGIIMEYDGRGPIVVSEFARESDLSLFPEDYWSAYARSRNDVVAPPTYMITDFYVVDMTKCFEWVGKNLDDTPIAPAYILDDGVTISIELRGVLFDQLTVGTAYLQYDEDTDETVIYRIILRSYDGKFFEQWKSDLAKLLGAPSSTGQSPYAADSGGAVDFAWFDTPGYSLEITEASNYDYTQVDIIPPDYYR